MNRKVKLSQIVKYSLFMLALIQFSCQISLLTRGVEYIVTDLTVDDTYYYLQPAWNFKKLGFVTFDGIHRTNGVQLLWFGIVVLLAMLVPSKTVLLYATLVICFLLNSLCYLVIWQVGKRLRRPILSLFLAGLWSMQSFSRGTYSEGMENSLHAFVLWCAVWQILVVLMQAQNNRPVSYFGVAITLTLNAWTRFDAGLTSVVLYVYCILMVIHYAKNNETFWHKNTKSIFSSSVIGMLGFVLQLALYRSMDSSYLPVSGLVKSSVANLGWDGEFLKRLGAVAVLNLSGIFPWRFLLTLFVLVGVLNLMKANSNSPALKALQFLWRGLAASWLLHHIIIVKTGVLGKGKVFNLYPWHNTPWIIFGIITIALTVEFFTAIVDIKSLALRICGCRPIKLVRISKLGSVVSCFLIIMISGYLFLFRVKMPLRKDNLYSVRYRAALWMAENLPVDEVYASWNAGQLGFFSDRTVINLDGLVNSVKYYNRVLQGPVLLEDYLRENQVRYVIDYTYGNRLYWQLIPYTDEEIPVEWETKYVFPRASGGEVIRVWELLP